MPALDRARADRGLFDGSRAVRPGARRKTSTAHLMADPLGQSQRAPNARIGRGPNLFHQHGPQSVDLQRNGAARLGNKINGAKFDRLQGCLGAFRGQRGNHHHRARRLDHDLAKAGQAIHARHLDIERDHLRIERSDQFECFVAIAGQTDVKVALLEENIFEQFAHEGRIVGDQKLDHRTVTGTSSSGELNLARTSASTWSSNCAGSTSSTIRPFISRLMTREIRRIWSGDNSGAGWIASTWTFMISHTLSTKKPATTAPIATIRTRCDPACSAALRSNRRRRSTIATTLPRRFITPSMKTGAFGNRVK